MSALRSLRSLRPARAPAVRHSLPVPVPPVPAGLESGGGVRLVAGLTWEIASGPEAPVLRADAPPVLRLPDRRARLAGTASGAAARAAPPGGSLLLALAAGLSRAVPDAAGPWAFIAELPRPDGGARPAAHLDRGRGHHRQRAGTAGRAGARAGRAPSPRAPAGKGRPTRPRRRWTRCAAISTSPTSPASPCGGCRSVTRRPPPERTGAP